MTVLSAEQCPGTSPHARRCAPTLPTRGRNASDGNSRAGRVTQPLLIEHHDGVDWVTLNRPDSLNARSR